MYETLFSCTGGGGVPVFTIGSTVKFSHHMALSEF